ncbi:TetR/AcrR family transcriptional regulator [soil metagenome]
MAVQSGVYRGVSAEDRAAERRERLLEATLSVWADSDARTTMTAVCAAAGLSERYFYESFASLDEALTAVLDDIAVEIEQTQRLAADSAGTDPGALVRASVAAFFGLIVNDPRKGRVAIIEAGAMPALRVRRTELLRHFAHIAAEEARTVLVPPERDPHADEMAGLVFVGGMAELVTAWLDGAIETTPLDLVETATRSFLALYS